MADHRRFWLSAAILAAALCFGRVPSSASSIDSVDESATVVVRTVDGPIERIGAGVIVGRDAGRLLVATAAHVLGSSSPDVQTDSGDVVAAAKIVRIPGYDLAIIETVPYEGIASVAVTGSPALGEGVHVWGHRLARDFVESGASIVDLDPVLPEGAANGRFAIACEACDHGDSGAGVFDDRGRLLGILEGARRDQFGDVAFVQVEPIAPLEADIASNF